MRSRRRVPGPVPAVRVHGEAATCLFLTLLQNAVRFSPEGGEIEVRARVDAEISGTLKRPEVVGDYTAQALVIGPHKVASASGHAELRGGLDGTVSVQLSARDYQGPQAGIRSTRRRTTATMACAGGWICRSP